MKKAEREKLERLARLTYARKDTLIEADYCFRNLGCALLTVGAIYREAMPELDEIKAKLDELHAEFEKIAKLDEVS